MVPATGLDSRPLRVPSWDIVGQTSMWQTSSNVVLLSLFECCLCYFQFTNLLKIEFSGQWFYGGLTDLQGLLINNADRDVQQNWSSSSKKD